MLQQTWDLRSGVPTWRRPGRTGLYSLPLDAMLRRISCRRRGTLLLVATRDRGSGRRLSRDTQTPTYRRMMTKFPTAAFAVLRDDRPFSRWELRQLGSGHLQVARGCGSGLVVVAPALSASSRPVLSFAESRPRNRQSRKVGKGRCRCWLVSRMFTWARDERTIQRNAVPDSSDRALDPAVSRIHSALHLSQVIPSRCNTESGRAQSGRRPLPQPPRKTTALKATPVRRHPSMSVVGAVPMATVREAANPELLCELPKRLGFASPVDDRSHDPAGQPSVLHLEGVRAEAVHAELLRPVARRSR